MKNEILRIINQDGNEKTDSECLDELYDYLNSQSTENHLIKTLKKIEKTLKEKHLGHENHTYELTLISEILERLESEK